MRHLLDFPPEIFKVIIRELISEAGLDKAWKLRQVCSKYATKSATRVGITCISAGTFEVYISDDIFFQQPKEFLSVPRAWGRPLGHRILREKLGLYLYNRTIRKRILSMSMNCYLRGSMIW